MIILICDSEYLHNVLFYVNLNRNLEVDLGEFTNINLRGPCLNKFNTS